jgi:hypothetical protein
LFVRFARALANNLYAALRAERGTGVLSTCGGGAGMWFLRAERLAVRALCSDGRRALHSLRAVLHSLRAVVLPMRHVVLPMRHVVQLSDDRVLSRSPAAGGRVSTGDSRLSGHDVSSDARDIPNPIGAVHDVPARLRSGRFLPAVRFEPMPFQPMRRTVRERQPVRRRGLRHGNLWATCRRLFVMHPCGRRRAELQCRAAREHGAVEQDVRGKGQQAFDGRQLEANPVVARLDLELGFAAHAGRSERSDDVGWVKVRKFLAGLRVFRTGERHCLEQAVSG